LLGRLFLAAGDGPKPTAIILHGLPGIEQNHDLAHALRDQGWNTVIFHYQGCWGSGGEYAFKTQPDDAIVCLDYLETGIHPQVDTSRLVLIGHSMGGWAAGLTAARDPRPKALAVISGVGDPAKLRFDDPVMSAAEFFPWLPGLTAESFGALWRGLAGIDELNPARQIARLSPRPLLMIHPELDDVVPIDCAREVFAQA